MIECNAGIALFMEIWEEKKDRNYGFARVKQ